MTQQGNLEFLKSNSNSREVRIKWPVWQYRKRCIGSPSCDYAVCRHCKPRNCFEVVAVHAWQQFVAVSQSWQWWELA